MPRPPRELQPGATYHVTSRGNERKAIARDDADWRVLTDLLAATVRKRGWRVLTYCFMPNHLHLVVRTPEPDLSDGMREALGDYARRFNLRHERTGHLFQGRFHAGEVVSDAHAMELHRYVALNPVRAGLVAVPERWAWSAHLPFLGLAPPPAFLDRSLEPFDGNVDDYAGFVAGASRSHLLDLLGPGTPDRLELARASGFSQRQIAAELGVGEDAVKRRLKGV
ncbi:MAG: hypothetical protein JWO90_284 [Solirubrobacterales bacterium]|jgi:putative transposase|nr:hypothetical protein [Solirubrobacterales bacterium]